MRNAVSSALLLGCGRTEPIWKTRENGSKRGEVSETTLPILFDTDVLIWYFRGLETAATFISETPFERRLVGSVCIMELIQGCRNKREIKEVMTFVKESFSRIVHCDKTISEKAVGLLRAYALSHGLRTIDALIAATAVTSEVTLATGNYRHFEMIEKVRLLKFDPKGALGAIG
jgi:predicted nucleic acid-binding protein